MTRLFCIAILGLWCLHAIGASPDSTNWRIRAAAWRSYISSPSPRNGERLYKLLPSVTDHSIALDSSSYWAIYGDLWSLKQLVVKQERAAVKIAFKLFAICDADFCETLNEILGPLIRINPTMFLEELSRHRRLVGHLGGLVGSLGDEFVDQRSRTLRELELRVNSLKTVQKPALHSMRDECIAELNGELRLLSETH